MGWMMGGLNNCPAVIIFHMGWPNSPIPIISWFGQGKWCLVKKDLGKSDVIVKKPSKLDIYTTFLAVYSQTMVRLNITFTWLNASFLTITWPLCNSFFTESDEVHYYFPWFGQWWLQAKLGSWPMGPSTSHGLISSVHQSWAHPSIMLYYIPWTHISWAIAISLKPP